jgi:hypothetical protein
MIQYRAIFNSPATLESALAIAPFGAGCFRFSEQYGPAAFVCSQCQQTKPLNTDGNGGTGYARTPAGDAFLCYECCGRNDLREMISFGEATLYLTMPGADVDMGVREGKDLRTGTLTNWPGTLSFTLQSGCMQTRRHNMAGKAYHVWFKGPDGADWHGVQYGDNTQLCHVKRLGPKVTEGQPGTVHDSTYIYLGYDAVTGLHKFRDTRGGIAGNVELYARRDGYAGHTLRLGKKQYEFVRTA